MKAKIKEWFKIWGTSLIFGIMILILFKNYNDDLYREDALKKTKKTIGIILKITHGAVRQPKSSQIEYKVHGKKYKFWEGDDFDEFLIGDTVKIAYSIKDNSVAKVIDKHYMKKHRN